MCPELSQDVSQYHLSRAFYPESVTYDKFHQQHTFSFNHVPHFAVYKPSDEHMLDAAGSSAGGAAAAAVGQHVQPSQAVAIGMVGGGSHHGQEPYTGPLPPAAAPEASMDYPLDISCDDNHLMPEIDCGWMKEVLDDFLLTSQEIPPSAPLNIAQCSTINLPSLLSPLGIPSKGELPAVSPHPHLLAHPASPTTKVASLSTSPRPVHVEAMQMGEQVAAPAGGPKSPAKSKSSSSTPEPLRTRASKRLQKDESTRKISKWAHKANLTINVDQVEHVIRERQRRDDMSYKIATLEGLLPQGPKRDRASIVHDSVQYVKSLQERVGELKKKSAELQTKRSTRSSSPVVVSKEEVRVRTPGEESEKAFRIVNFHVQVEAGDDAVTLSSCRCNLDFLSLTMKALEQLQLDLCRSSITKMPDDSFFCVIASKPRIGASAVPSSSTLALTIKAAVEL